MVSFKDVEVYTTNEPAMTKNLEYRGLVMVSKVKSRNIFSDISSCFISCCGGEIKDLSKLTKEVREELLEELKEKAVGVGANAVVGVRMETNSVYDGMVDMVMVGTAVYFTR